MPHFPRAVGPYRLERRLGGGGLGAVFLGRSPDRRTVAVKLVRPEFAAAPGFRLRFAAQVNAARRVDGPRTGRLVDADPDAGPPWLATAYVPSLREAVDLDGPLPPPAVAALGSGLAEALAAIHGCGLLHHDLTPSNVILAEDGPRVIDFGIAGVADDPSRAIPRPAIGTPSFTSPEQALAHDVGPPADVFALGAVLAFAATGRLPFGSGPAEAVLHRVVHGDPDLTGLPEPAPPSRPATSRSAPTRRSTCGTSGGRRPRASRAA
ncbi:serine/threonine-protein kinase [Actinomadura sp. LOL_016]|uniref:serine/threonine-protein kinase n=1 Tax=unclassified Actinomadura TaxID=2626254 RepID=UPI003A8057B1